MKRLERAAAGLLTALWIPAWCSAQAAEPGPYLKAMRAQARELIAEEALRLARREVDPAVVRADAARVAAELDAARLAELLGERNAGALLAERASRRRQRGSLSNLRSAALGNAETDLLLVPLAPCRIIDTRQISSGLMQASQTRHFLVAGTNGFLAQGGTGGGCGIPDGGIDPLAPAVVVNFIAVSPQGSGHLTAWEFGQAVPDASVINYANVPGLNIANGVVIPIAGTSSSAFDISIVAAVSPTHVVADVTGYFTRFPVEQFAQPQKDRLVVATKTTPTELSTDACAFITSCQVTAPPGVGGRVLVKTWAQVQIDHTTGTHDRITVGAKLGLDPPDAPNCNPITDQVANMDFELPDVAPTAVVDATISHGRDFPINGGQINSYSLLGKMIVGASAGDRVESARMLCLFIPD